MTALADRPRLLASLSPSEKHQMLYRLAVDARRSSTSWPG
jgi:hypothetical protein